MSEYRVEVRPNDDGSVDEVVLNADDGPGCIFHLEQLDDDHYWFAVYLPDDERHFDIRRRGKRVVVTER